MNKLIGKMMNGKDSQWIELDHYTDDEWPNFLRIAAYVLFLVLVGVGMLALLGM